MFDMLKDRQFQVWDYSVSHQRLLIRSPQSKERTQNVDIIFYGVEFINLSTILGELSIRIEEIEGAKRKNFFLQVDKGEYVVRALDLQIVTSDTDIFISPLDTI